MEFLARSIVCSIITRATFGGGGVVVAAVFDFIVKVANKLRLDAGVRSKTSLTPVVRPNEFQTNAYVLSHFLVYSC